MSIFNILKGKEKKQTKSLNLRDILDDTKESREAASREAVREEYIKRLLINYGIIKSDKEYLFLSDYKEALILIVDEYLDQEYIRL